MSAPSICLLKPAIRLAHLFHSPLLNWLKSLPSHISPHVRTRRSRSTARLLLLRHSSTAPPPSAPRTDHQLAQVTSSRTSLPLPMRSSQEVTTDTSRATRMRAIMSASRGGAGSGGAIGAAKHRATRSSTVPARRRTRTRTRTRIRMLLRLFHLRVHNQSRTTGARIGRTVTVEAVTVITTATRTRIWSAGCMESTVRTMLVGMGMGTDRCTTKALTRSAPPTLKRPRR